MNEFFWKIFDSFLDWLCCAMPFLGLIGIACVIIFLVKKLFKWVDSEENQSYYDQWGNLL